MGFEDVKLFKGASGNTPRGEAVRLNFRSLRIGVFWVDSYRSDSWRSTVRTFRSMLFHPRHCKEHIRNGMFYAHEYRLPNPRHTFRSSQYRGVANRRCDDVCFRGQCICCRGSIAMATRRDRNPRRCCALVFDRTSRFRIESPFICCRGARICRSGYAILGHACPWCYFWPHPRHRSQCDH